MKGLAFLHCPGEALVLNSRLNAISDCVVMYSLSYVRRLSQWYACCTVCSLVGSALGHHHRHAPTLFAQLKATVLTSFEAASHLLHIDCADDFAGRAFHRHRHLARV